MQSPAREIIALDIAIARSRERDARSAGRVDDADRSLLKLLEQYGDDLEKLDPRAYADAKSAQNSLSERGALSTFEKNLFTQGKEREALSDSLSTLKDAQSSADILDQVRSR